MAGEVNRVRTGYETVIAHRTSETFATPALYDGVVTEINTQHHLLKVKYSTGESVAISYGESYTNVSGSYLKQDLIPNVTQGESFHKGDILVYHPGFFTPEPDSKQVSWKHGVNVNVALMETSATLEDGCVISKELGKDLTLSPAHIRPVRIDSKTALYDIISVGSQVESTDILCSVEQGDLESLTLTDDPSTISFLASLNRKAPTAHYHGKVAEISVFYACAFDQLHKTIQKLVTEQTKHHTAYTDALKGTDREATHYAPGQVNVGLKYHDTEFEPGTVLIEFTITDDIVAGQGDKICLGLQCKTVVSAVFEKNPVSESGTNIEMVFGCTSVQARILASPFILGIGNRVLEQMEKDVISMYFD